MNKEELKENINKSSKVVGSLLVDYKNKEDEWKNDIIEIKKVNLFALINQLDEPETLSDEWIDEHEKREQITGPFGNMYLQHVVPSRYLQNLLVPKQEELVSKADELKPVVPQFVWNWIDLAKSRYLTLFQAMVEYADTDIKEWLWKYFNSDLFGKAWLAYPNIEVEEEQKYKVIIKDGKYVRLFLCKIHDVVTIGTNENYIEKCPEVTYLTEQEIKDYDERYFAFAVPVEEEEE